MNDLRGSMGSNTHNVIAAERDDQHVIGLVGGSDTWARAVAIVKAKDVKMTRCESAGCEERTVMFASTHASWGNKLKKRITPKRGVNMYTQCKQNGSASTHHRKRL